MQLPGAREKLQRAEHHVKGFIDGFSDFLRENPQRVMQPLNSYAGNQARFVCQPSIPGSVVCAVGDAVHNLRCALDHIAYAAATRNQAVPGVLKNATFTIRETRAEFDVAVAQPQVTGIGTAWLDFLRGVEPYAGGKAAELFVVSKLDNLDKHRDLLIVDTFADTFLWDETAGVAVPVQRGLSFTKGVAIALDPSEPNHYTMTQRIRLSGRSAVARKTGEAYKFTGRKLLKELPKLGYATLVTLNV